MATFYGTVIGSRGEVNRTGTKSSGIKVAARSFDGSVIVRLCDADADKPFVDISIADGSDVYGKNVFFGTIEELKAKLA